MPGVSSHSENKIFEYVNVIFNLQYYTSTNFCWWGNIRPPKITMTKSVMWVWLAIWKFWNHHLTYIFDPATNRVKNWWIFKWQVFVFYALETKVELKLLQSHMSPRSKIKQKHILIFCQVYLIKLNDMSLDIFNAAPTRVKHQSNFLIRLGKISLSLISFQFS